MNHDDSFQKKMDAVWEKYLIFLAIEKLKKVEQLERQAQSGR